MNNIDFIPEKLTIQWHITNHCNNRCIHCYQDDFSKKDELTFEKFLLIVQQICFLIEKWRKKLPIFKAHINITGGEPFIHSDFFKIISTLHQNKTFFSFAILSNGSLIDEKTADFLAKQKPGFVQLSIEGDKKTNDEIRTKGSFQKTLTALKILKKHKIKTLVSFTASKINYKEFPKVAKIARKHGASQVWADRYLPFGQKYNKSDNYVLNADETKEFFKMMYKEKNRIPDRWLYKTEISMQRALQFLCGGENIYRCTAGEKLLTIMPNGDIYPCRRLPIQTGNVFESNIETIYQHNKLFLELRSTYLLDDNCKSCSFGKRCQGGLRCLSFAQNGNMWQKDSSCFATNNFYEPQ